MSAVRFGDPARFYFGVTWLDCPPLGDMANAHTWCELSIVVQGVSVTRHETASGNIHDSLAVPAAPVAAWLGQSWAALVGEERLFEASGATSAHAAFESLSDGAWEEDGEVLDAFIEGHALYRAPGGLLLPNVFFWRRGDEVVVSWRPGAEGNDARRVTFTGYGSARVPAALFFEACRRFIHAVDERARKAPESSLMRAEVAQAKRRIDSLESFEVLAARVGRDVVSFAKWLKSRTRDQNVRDALVEGYGPEMGTAHVCELLDSPVAMAARSSSPAFTKSDHESLLRLGVELRQQATAKKLLDLRKRLENVSSSGVNEEGFELGYRRAEEARRLLKQKRGPVDPEAVLRDLGCALRDVGLDDIETDGVALWTRDGQSLVAANVASPKTATTWGRRAMLAHELYHLLFDASASGFFGECTSRWSSTTSEQAANAFAAELLLPVGSLKELPARGDAEGWRHTVSTLRLEYGTGWELTVRHLENRHRMAHAVAAALLGEGAA